MWYHIWSLNFVKIKVDSDDDLTLEKTVTLHNVLILVKLGDTRNCMPPILVPSSAKRIARQILMTAKLGGRKDFILRDFVCDIIRLSKELPVQN